MARNARPVAPRDLQIDEDRVFQERMWTAERIAWVGFVLILAVALLGLTGQGGPLQRVTLRSDAAQIDYPRVTRWETSDEIVLTLSGAPGAAEAVIETDQTFAQVFEIEDIQPAPAESLALPHGQRLVFALGEGGSGQVTLHVRAMKPSLGRAIGFQVDGEPMTITPVVLP